MSIREACLLFHLVIIVFCVVLVCWDFFFLCMYACEIVFCFVFGFMFLFYECVEAIDGWREEESDHDSDGMSGTFIAHLSLSVCLCSSVSPVHLCHSTSVLHHHLHYDVHVTLRRLLLFASCLFSLSCYSRHMTYI